MTQIYKTASNAGFVTQSSGSFTPTLLFGGGNTGQTGTYTGRYTKTGNLVNYTISITLTAKGSSSGSATIAALPFTSSANQTPSSTAPLFLQNCTASSTTYVNFSASVGMSSVSATLSQYSQAANPSLALTDASFTNTSIIALSGFYFTDS